MFLKSSAQRAFSLKFEKVYCHRTGVADRVTPRALQRDAIPDRAILGDDP
jgi:hypothetical protein